MAHFDAHLRYSDVGLLILILKFCCMCNKAEYGYKTKDKGRRRWGGGIWGRAVPLSPSKIFDDLIFKWHILMHISGILTYLFQVLLSLPGEGSAEGAVPLPENFW